MFVVVATTEITNVPRCAFGEFNSIFIHLPSSTKTTTTTTTSTAITNICIYSHDGFSIFGAHHQGKKSLFLFFPQTMHEFARTTGISRLSIVTTLHTLLVCVFCESILQLKTQTGLLWENVDGKLFCCHQFSIQKCVCYPTKWIEGAKENSTYRIMHEWATILEKSLLVPLRCKFIVLPKWSRRMKKYSLHWVKSPSFHCNVAILV